MPDFETWVLLLQAARASESHDPVFAETCLRQALSSAEESQGKDSTEAGLCLAELAIFLKRRDRASEAEELNERYKEILGNFTRKLGLNKSA